MNKATEMVVGAFGGAVASVLLELLIVEVKHVVAFKSVFEELASTMKDLRPIVKEIESLQKEDDLKSLKVTIAKAHVLVKKCSVVRGCNLLSKAYYTRKVEKVNRKVLNFCQVQLQILQLRNQLQSNQALCAFPIEEINNYLQIISNRLDLLGDPTHVYKDFCLVPKLDKVPIGLDLPLTELKKKLLDNDVVSLVVSAPPGCGKTTLVTHLCHDAKITEKFKHIFFTVVSSTPNFRVIVQNLLQHNGYQALTFENDSQAVVGLRKLLEELQKKGPILLVLDDVWRGAESLLQKFRINLPDSKILVTSRSDFPSFGSTYHLKPLKYEDAEALLVQWAPQPRHATTREYKDLLQKILRHCNGFPILIEVIGGSLKGQPLYVWKGKLESWSEGETILDEDDVLKCLQRSFDALKPHFQDCFMDMGLFREDQKIRASVIIDIWIELYGKGSNSCMKDLNDLASQNLLKLIPLGGNGVEDGFYNEFLVTQHDILRELAIRQSELEGILEREKLNFKNLEAILERKRLNLEIIEDKFPDWCLISALSNLEIREDRQQLINARLLSISTDDSFSSNWVDMDFPNVEALVLNLSSSNYALPSFIATMKKLKVVIIINHGPDPARLTNLSCLSSLPNLKRIRFEKVSITLLDILQLQLHSLNKLSLVMCSFGKVSHDTKEIDVSKALPSLQEIDIDYCYDLDELPCWVSEVISLMTLSITNCNKLNRLPEAIGDLSKLEVLRLSSCINLSELPETAARLSKLRSMDISDCLGLRKLPLEIGNLPKLEKISMRKCSRCELPDSVRNLENLVVKCDEETGSLWEKLKPKMTNLEVHEVETEHNLNLFKMF